MKKIKLILLLIIVQFSVAMAQEKVALYDITLDPFKQIAEAKIKAQQEDKNILVQAGGNWCSWCRLFHKFSKENKKVDSILQANYVFVLANFSKENKNEAFFKAYKNPGRFGYPAFLILNPQGELLHIQDSGYLEEGKGYSEEKVSRFLLLWNKYSTKDEK
jgi:thioredoxin-related protein